ncbi:perosamine synthetase [Spirosomataceae bacterium TFI 002]|nr:perosamine synthetase [Spirosomataceae bacterium TFI 002]
MKKQGILHSYLSNLAFEQEFSKHLGGEYYCLSVNSASSGLFAIFKSLGIKNGEVILAAMNWPGSIWFFELLGLKPILVDINLETFTIDPADVQDKISYKTVAIMATDMFGYPCDWKSLKSVADNACIPLIGDCAQSFGSYYNQQQSGCLADAAVVSFGAGKIFSLGEGGMIYTRNKSTFSQLLKEFGHPDIQRIHLGRVESNLVGNFRMNPMAADEGSSKISKVLEYIKAKFNEDTLGSVKIPGTKPNFHRQIIPLYHSLNESYYMPIPKEYLLTPHKVGKFKNVNSLYNSYGIINN